MEKDRRVALSNRDVTVSDEEDEKVELESTDVDRITPSSDCYPLRRYPFRRQIRRKARQEIKENDCKDPVPNTAIKKKADQSTANLQEMVKSFNQCSGASNSTDTKRRKSLNWPNFDGKIYGMAFHSDGTLAVVYFAKRCIYRFNSEYNIIQIINCSKVNGRCTKPAAISFDSEGNLYVTDIRYHKVLKFDQNGTFLYQFGRKGSCDGQLDYPTGISVLGGSVYVADSRNARVSVFTTDGTFQCTIGDGKLGKPHDISTNDQQQIVVADMAHKCVYVFTIDGNYCSRFGTGQFYRPQCLTTFIGFTYVVDSYNHNLLVFNTSGECVCQCNIGTTGHSRSPSSQPLGITINQKGRLLVSGDCIHEFPIRVHIE
ncbi:tripartite motif-containing protein 2-like [Dysidea avara]|uniref:tripartite motif-containing protein 2-like n=1 Tax=Dysidea avara TaxID=196820 RepID=UPI0033184FFB